MAQHGLNSMQLQIQGLFRDTVFQFNKEWNKHMTYLEEIVPSVQEQTSTKSRRYLGLAAPPSEVKAKVERKHMAAATPKSHFFTPYSSGQSASRLDNVEAFALPEVTPLAGRRRQQGKRNVEDMQRSSINAKSLNTDDNRGNVRRSMRLNGERPEIEKIHTPPKIRSTPKRATSKQNLQQDDRGVDVRRSTRLAGKEEDLNVSIDPDLWIKTPPRLKARREKRATQSQEEGEEEEEEKERDVVEEEEVFVAPKAKSSKSSRGKSLTTEEDEEEEDDDEEDVDAEVKPKLRRSTRSSVRRSTVNTAKKEFEVPKPLKRNSSKSEDRRTSRRLQKSEESAAVAKKRTSTRLNKKEEEIVELKMEEKKEKSSSSRVVKKKIEEVESQKQLEEEQQQQPKIKVNGKKKQSAEPKEKSSKIGKKKKKEEEEGVENSKKNQSQEEENIEAGPSTPKRQTRSRITKAEDLAKINMEEVTPSLVQNEKKTVGKRVAQLLSKYEEEGPVHQRAAASPRSFGPKSLSLTKEEGLDLSSRLEAIANGALEAVSEKSTEHSKRKIPANERAMAWSSRRETTHSSLRDLLAANGIVRPDASENTVQNALEAIPETVGEVGDEEAVKSTMHLLPTRTPPTTPRLGNKAYLSPSIFDNKEEDEEEEDSGVSDSEDVVVPPKMPEEIAVSTPKKQVEVATIAFVSSNSPPPALTLEKEEEQQEVKPLHTIQDKIAEMRKKFGTASVSKPTLSTPTSLTPPSSSLSVPSSDTNAISKMILKAPEESPAFEVSLNLGGDQSNVGISSNDSAALQKSETGIVVEDDAEEGYSYSESKHDIAPGLFTAEITTHELRAVHEKLNNKKKSGGGGGGGSKTPPSLNQDPSFSTFMDSSFMGGVGDSVVYNTLDAEKAMNAVQFLEQIQLNGDAVNITLTGAALDDLEDEGSQSFNLSNASNSNLNSSRTDDLNSSPLLSDEDEREEEQEEFEDESPNPRKRSAEDALEPMTKQKKEDSLISSNEGKVSIDSERKKSKQQKNESVLPISSHSTKSQPAKTSKASSHHNSTSKGTTSTGNGGGGGGGGGGVKDKLVQAKQRREKLEEEERKRREDVIRKAAEREQRAKALKEGKNIPVPVSAPPSSEGGGKLNAKAAIIEKGKRNAEKLAKDKLEEMRRKKQHNNAPSSIQQTAQSQQPLTASSSTNAPSEKKGMFNPFKMLKKPNHQSSNSNGAISVVVEQTQPKPSVKPSILVKENVASPLPVKSPRPSPLRKAKDQRSPSTQYSISPCKMSDVEEENDPSNNQQRKKLKREAKWAKKDVLQKSLREQQFIDADDVFGAPVGLTCNLQDVFNNYKPRKKYQVRTSSAQWSDAGTSKPLYKK